MRNKRTIGSRYEDMAAAYLSKQGVTVLTRNYRSATGEIDLIGKEGEILLFVEVKGRYTARMGDPGEAVTPQKQRTIRQVALWYMMKMGLPEETPCRFDVVTILGENIQWIKNAF